MALLRVDLAGTDRTSVTQHGSLALATQLDGPGSGALRILSTGGWRPGLLDRVEIWQPCTTVGDAAITGVAKTQLETTSIAWTTAHVGQHVRLQDGLGSSTPLRTEISAYVASSAVTLLKAAATTMSGKELWLGYARFFGQVHDVKENRSRPDHLVYDVTLSDLTRACEWILPYATYYASLSTLKDRITSLLADSEITTHGVYLYWPSTNNGFLPDDGIYQYDRSLKAILDDLLVQDDAGRNWHVDALGRLWISRSTERPSGYTLSTADANVRVVSPPTVTKSGTKYANRTVVGYDSPTQLAVSCSTAEQDALGGRIFEFYEGWSPEFTPDLGQASARAAWWLDYYGTRSAYTADLETTVDPVYSGQTLTVTLPIHGMSSTVHLVQAVQSRYEPVAGIWLHQLGVTNGTVRRTSWQDYWRSLR